MKQIFVLGILCIVLGVFTVPAQQVGINVTNPTEALDVGGQVRIRDLPMANALDRIVLANDSGVLANYPLDSFTTLVGGAPVTTLTLIAGDTITAGDCIAMGDGLTGALRIQTNAIVTTFDAVTSIAWCAQTFVTGPKTRALKAVVVDLSVNATTPSNMLYCSVRQVVGGIPSGPDINGQVSIAEGPAGNAGYQTEARMVFDPPLVLSPNTPYALVLRSQFTGTTMQLYKQNLSGYTNGHACVSMNAGSTWTIQPTFDFNTLIYFSETEAGKAYLSNPNPSGSNVIGWNAANACIPANGCPQGFFGKSDRYDNVVGIAQHDALPGQMVSIQVSGATSTITGFPLGRKLYLSTIPGKLTLSSSSNKSVGLSTGTGMIIQVTF